MQFEKLETRWLLTSTLSVSVPSHVEADTRGTRGHLKSVRDITADGHTDIVFFGTQPLLAEEAASNPERQNKQWLGLISSQSIASGDPRAVELPLSGFDADVSHVESDGDQWLRLRSVGEDPTFIRRESNIFHLFDLGEVPAGVADPENYSSEFPSDFDGDGVRDWIRGSTLVVSAGKHEMLSNEYERISDAFPIGDFDGDGADDFVVVLRERFDPDFGYWWAQISTSIRSRNGTIPFDTGRQFILPHTDKGAHHLDAVTPAPEEWGPGFFASYLSDGAPNGVFVFVGRAGTMEVDFDPRERFKEAPRQRPFDFNGDGVNDEVNYLPDNPEWVALAHGLNLEIVLGRNATPTCGAGNLVGDTDGNGVVDFADFLRLASNYGQDADVAFADGDFNCDGVIDFDDFLAFFDAYDRGLNG